MGGWVFDVVVGWLADAGYQARPARHRDIA